MSKQCSRCKEIKPLEEFKNKSWCRPCAYEYERIRWANKTQKQQRSKWLWTKYKITYDEYEKLYNDQNGKCKICTDDISLMSKDNSKNIACVDHDHSTGQIRGLLCNHCNRALGLMKENIQYIQNMIKYLGGVYV